MVGARISSKRTSAILISKRETQFVCAKQTSFQGKSALQFLKVDFSPFLLVTLFNRILSQEKSFAGGAGTLHWKSPLPQSSCLSKVYF